MQEHSSNGRSIFRSNNPLSIVKLESYLHAKCNHRRYRCSPFQLGEDQIYRSLRDDSPPSDVSLHSVSGRPLVGTSSGAVGGNNNGGGATEKWKLSDKLSFRSNHSNGSAAAGDHHHLQEVIRHGRTKKNSLTGNSGSVTTSATTPSEQYVNHR